MAENSLIDVIAEKFNKSTDEVDDELIHYLNDSDFNDQGKQEAINDFKSKLNTIFDMKNANTFLDFVTNVYGKSNIAFYINLELLQESADKVERTNLKELVYLHGKLDLKNKIFDFEKNDFFTYGNFHSVEQDIYEFTSYKSQDSYLFVKVDSNYAYGVFDAHSTRKMYFRLKTDFFQNPTMDVIDDSMDGVEDWIQENSDDDVDKLFEAYKSGKGNLKEFIVYQLDN